MAKRVVDALEVIDVGHQQQRRLADPGHTVQFAGNRRLKLTSIGQARQRIAARQVAQPVHDPLQPGRAVRHQIRGHHPSGLLQQTKRFFEAQATRSDQVGRVAREGQSGGRNGNAPGKRSELVTSLAVQYQPIRRYTGLSLANRNIGLLRSQAGSRSTDKRPIS